MSDAMINLAGEGAGSSVGQGVHASIRNTEKSIKFLAEFLAGMLILIDRMVESAEKSYEEEAVDQLKETAESNAYAKEVENELENTIRNSIYSKEIISELLDNGEFIDQVVEELIERGASEEFINRVVKDLEELKEKELELRYTNQVVKELESVEAEIIEEEALAEENAYSPSMGELRQFLKDAYDTNQSEENLEEIIDNIKKLAESYGSSHENVPDDYSSTDITFSEHNYQAMASIKNKAAELPERSYTPQPLSATEKTVLTVQTVVKSRGIER